MFQFLDDFLKTKNKEKQKEEEHDKDSIWEFLKTQEQVLSIRPSIDYFDQHEKFYEHLDVPLYTISNSFSLLHKPTEIQQRFLSWALKKEYIFNPNEKPFVSKYNWIPFLNQKHMVYGGGSGDKCGTGKSFEALCLISENTPTLSSNDLYDVVNNATLIVAPSNVLEMSWKKELDKHVPSDLFDIIFYTGPNRKKKLEDLKKSIQVSDKTSNWPNDWKQTVQKYWPKKPFQEPSIVKIKEKSELKSTTFLNIDEIQQLDYNHERKSSLFQGKKPLVILTSYETISYELENKETRKEGLFDIIKVWWRIILDESHSIRNLNSKRYNYIQKLRGINKWCMSATLFVNRPDDLFPMFQFLGVFDTFSSWKEQIIQYPDRLDTLMNEYCMSRDSKIYIDCKKDERYVQVRMDPLQKIIYSSYYQKISKEFKIITSHIKNIPKCSGYKNILRRLRNKVDNQVLRLLQISNHPYTAFHNLDKYPELKHIWNTIICPDKNKLDNQKDESTCDICFDSLPSESNCVGFDTYVLNPCLHICCRNCAIDLITYNDYEDTTHICFCKQEIHYYTNNNQILDPVSIQIQESKYQHKKTNNLGITLKEIDIQSLSLEQIQNNIFKNDTILSRLYNHSYKHDILMKCISNLIPKSTKIVILCRWLTQLRILELQLKEHGYSYSKIEGRVPKKDRYSILTSFENSKKTHILILQSQTCGTGINITKAKVMFVLHKEFNLATETQQTSRLHRLDQIHDKIDIVHLLSHHTIEKRMLKLQRKKDRIKQLVMPTLQTKRIQKRKKERMDIDWEIKNTSLLKEPNPLKHRRLEERPQSEDDKEDFIQ